MHNTLQLGALDLDKTHVCYIVQSVQESFRRDSEELKPSIALNREF